MFGPYDQSPSVPFFNSAWQLENPMQMVSLWNFGIPIVISDCWSHISMSSPGSLPEKNGPLHWNLVIYRSNEVTTLASLSTPLEQSSLSWISNIPPFQTLNPFCHWPNKTNHKSSLHVWTLWIHWLFNNNGGLTIVGWVQDKYGEFMEDSGS